MFFIYKLVQQFLGPRLSTDQVADTEKQCYTGACSQDPQPFPTPRRRPSDIDVGGNGLQALQENAEDVNSLRSYRILPIFSGIMIPFSIMLLIPSLTGHWYIRTGARNVVVQVQSNPLLLQLAMGISMGCGIIASACLVVRFAERNVKLMTHLCIFFLSLHDLINVPAVTIFGVIHRFDDGFTYGQPFWLTVCSTIASTATNLTLIYDYKQTADFGNSGSGLTHKQRSLVIIVIIMHAYMSLGSGVLSVMLNITFIDALYFSVVSIDTIGFGDIHPTSAGSRVFVCFYIAGGILNFALAVALCREVLLEAVAVGFQNRIKALRAREREQHILIRWRTAVRWRLRSKGLPVWIDDHPEEREARIGLRRTYHWYSSLRRFWRRLWDEAWREWEDPAWRYVYGPNQTRLNLDALSHSQLETAALEAGAPLSKLIPKGLKLGNRERGEVHSPSSQFSSSDANSHPPLLTHVRIAGMVAFLATFAIGLTHEAFKEDPATETSSETTHEGRCAQHTGNGLPLTRSMTMTMTLQDDHMDLAKSLEIEERNAFYTRLGVAWTLFVIFWMSGSAIFMKTEKWTFGSSAYFCFITFSSVGYGDFAPTTPAGRAIFVFWALLGVGTMTILISILSDAYSDRYKSFISSELLKSNTKDSEENQQYPGFSTSPSNSNAQRCNPPDVFTPGRSNTPPSSSMSRLGERSTMISTSSTSDGAVVQGPHVKEQLHKLSFQIVQHTNILRSIMDMEVSEKVGADWSGSDQDALRFRIERSLKEVTKAVDDVLAASQI